VPERPFRQRGDSQVAQVPHPALNSTPRPCVRVHCPVSTPTRLCLGPAPSVDGRGLTALTDTAELVQRCSFGVVAYPFAWELIHWIGSRLLRGRLIGSDPACRTIQESTPSKTGLSSRALDEFAEPYRLSPILSVDLMCLALTAHPPSTTLALFSHSSELQHQPIRTLHKLSSLC
jgi:hypothetical protein